MRFTVLAALAAILTLGTVQADAQELRDQEVRDELRTLVTGDDPATADRAIIREFLGDEDVQRVADRHGLDIEGAEAGIRTLSADEAANIAQRVLDSEAYLAGGDTVVITSTTILIILLIILLISI
ncbi:MAG: hypothetical protein R6U63_01120 [Longimicrobiales bacterium]